jgi:hypothetical protein
VSGSTGALDFQCLYFDAEWNPAVRLAVAATATKHGKNWLFSDAVVTPIPPPGIPYP